MKILQDACSFKYPQIFVFAYFKMAGGQEVSMIYKTNT